MCLVYKHILLLKNSNHHEITNLVTLSLSWTQVSENCKRSEKSHQNWCKRHRCNFCIRDLSWGYATGKVIYPKYYKNSNESCTLFFWQIRISGLWWKFLEFILLSKCFYFHEKNVELSVPCRAFKVSKKVNFAFTMYSFESKLTNTIQSMGPGQCL